MGIRFRAISGLLLFIFFIVWVLLLTNEVDQSSYPRIYVAGPAAPNFDYILEPGDDVCSTPEPLLLIVYVHSAIENRHRRESIRSTWASRAMFGKHIRVLFMVGSSQNRELMKQAQFEFDTYRDIVQQTFIDAYRNLTYKGIMALNWISRHCNRTSYVLKTDDDMLINMFSILNHLYTLTHVYPMEAWHSTIACLVWTRMRVTRDPTSKWFVSSTEYPYEHFAPYCSGSAYFITQDLIRPLFQASRSMPFFWIDDYYITGLLPQAIRSSVYVNYLYINSLFVINIDLVEQRFLSPFGLSSLVFGHMPLSVDRLLHTWQHIVTNSHSAYKYLNRTSL
ncbi:unnamed protein product [Rotaria socialis]|uniref:Hexosyltransferase n=1 Tax=Rotaria socialis TaxID=392032 RepID=A0A820V4S0_9BILA|nr:unnamed protein product [Rotaria socialis]CAF3638105.1 unnamed protein product [Rotaria socialis]CAF4311078.1 unnamed protein product [Rotaria socialis]CAF4495873.1 unnamed protein product [Rotaria socialis]